MRMLSLVLSSLLVASIFGGDASDELNEENLLSQSSHCDPCESKIYKSTKAGRVSDLQKEMKEIFTQAVRGDFGAKAASSLPQIDGYGLYVKGDLLYWKSFQSNADFTTAHQSRVADPVTITEGSIKRFDFLWRFGFRATLGYKIPHDDWDFSATYTWFHDQASKSFSKDSFFVQPLITEDLATFQTASGSWKLKFQTLDLLFGKGYFLSRAFSVKPFFGLKTGWIDQTIRSSYNNAIAPSSMTNLSKNDFWGIGPLGGLDIQWHIGSHFNFISSFSGALLVGDFDVYTLTVNALNNSPYMSLVQNVDRLSPNLNGKLGIEWETRFNRDRCNISLQLLYESIYFWRQNQLYTFGNINQNIILYRNSEDLGIHGATFNAQFDF